MNLNLSGSSVWDPLKELGADFQEEVQFRGVVRTGSLQAADCKAAMDGGRAGETEERHFVPRILSAQSCLGPRALCGGGETGEGGRGAAESREGERENWLEVCFLYLHE